MPLAVDNLVLPDAIPAAAPSRRLGPYTLLREAGRGAAATVYEAIDDHTKRRVAVKVLERSHLVTSHPDGINAAADSAEKDPTASSDRDIARFLREAKTIALLAHPSIVAVFDVGEIDGLHYIAMEYIEGQTLRERLDTSGVLSPEELVPIIVQIAGALDLIHSRGIVHRDLKPTNVMLLPDGGVKVLDFGVAHLSHSDDATLTHAGALVGSPAYMSPEQIRGDDSTPASDIWALGVLAYEALCKMAPFGGTNIAAVLYRITNEPPMPLSGVSTEVEKAVRKALEKKRENRYTTASDFALALKAASKNVSAGRIAANTTSDRSLSPPATVMPAVNTTLPTVPSRPKRPFPLVLVGVLLVASIALVGAVLLSRHAPAPALKPSTKPAKAAPVKKKGLSDVPAARRSIPTPVSTASSNLSPRPVKVAAVKLAPRAPVVHPIVVSRPQPTPTVLRKTVAAMPPPATPTKATSAHRIAAVAAQHKPAMVTVTSAATVAVTAAISRPAPTHSVKPAPVPTPERVITNESAATSGPGLLGRWKGSVWKQSATLTVTHQSGENFAGQITLHTETGTVLIPVSGSLSSDTGRVTFAAEKVPEASGSARIGTQSGKLLDTKTMGGLGRADIGDGKQSVFTWTFSR